MAVDLQATFRQVPIFSDLDQGELEILGRNAVVKNFKKNDTIIHKNDKGDAFFTIVSGRVKVVLDDEDTKEFIVGIFKENDFFGELSLLDGEARSATVVAMEPTKVSVLRRDDFLSQLKQHPDICVKIMAVLSRRLRKSNESIESLAFMDVCGRVAKIILEMAEQKKSGADLDRDEIHIRVDHSRTELANLVGTTRETLTRALKTLETMGYLRIEKDLFIVTNVAGLRNRMV